MVVSDNMGTVIQTTLASTANGFKGVAIFVWVFLALFFIWRWWTAFVAWVSVVAVYVSEFKRLLK